ncbi:hypothetical protein MKZ38_008646 [Zalerion maritima]|uniref:Protein kinase domain-containing protein n=1 Tax=Zalerion maritima TaxID=339359 RepID=A0AAD5S6C3_9PEZI|nr:hypothetical protein MKZ38_008646 [Zalerion maritima]
MDLSVQAIHDIVHPTAVFSEARRIGLHPARHPSTEGAALVLENELQHSHHPHGSGGSTDDAEDSNVGGSSGRVPEPDRRVEPGTTRAQRGPESELGPHQEQDGDKDKNQSREQAAALWMQSELNPKNRIDSLDVPRNPMWRVDGCTGLGTQFYMIPLFLDPAPPLRVDVFIPEQAEQSPHTRSLLGLATAFHTKDAARVSNLGISKYIIRALHIWAESFADFPVMYKSLPFGSRIIFHNLPLDLRDIRIQVAHTYQLERHLFSLSSLASLWSISDPQNSPFFPDRVDLFSLEVIEQIHDSTSIVRYNGDLLIFKAITSYTKYIYHELYNLLSLTPHPNIISKPRHLVTKKCRFGSKTAIVGFTLEFHPPGTMRDIIPVRRLNGHLTAADQHRWATQITSALIHIHKTGGPFYPDLRLDNVVLTDGGNAVMVDFEQRGVWCEFGPPEINAVEHVRLLATDDDDSSSSSSYSDVSTNGSDEDLGREAAGGDNTQASLGDEFFKPEKYVDLLQQLLPEYEALLRREEYTDAGLQAGSYNIAWLALTPREREAAEVYMLGRVLYCIYEGVAAPNRAAVWQSYRWESDLEFPERARAPQRISELVDKCTRGRRANLTSRLRRVGDRITLVDQHGRPVGTVGGSEVEPDKIQEEATAFWRAEVEHAVEFLQERLAAMKDGAWNENHFERPSLKEVLAELQDISQDTVM